MTERNSASRTAVAVGVDPATNQQIAEANAGERGSDPHEFVDVSVELLRLDSTLGFDLFIKGAAQMVLYRERHLPLTRQVLDRLRENGVTTLWVPADDERKLGRYVETHLAEILEDPRLPPTHKAHAVYAASQNLAADILADASKETLARARPLVGRSVGALMRDPDILTSLLSRLETRYAVHTHCVNTSVYTVAYAHSAGYRDLDTASEFALAGLLHDIGKAHIPYAILDKPGPLTDSEWEVMRRHPAIGVDMVGDSRGLVGRAIDGISSHHEYWYGSGYPQGLIGNAIPINARVVAICETFDALTTARVYRPRLSPYEALVLMRDDLGGKFQTELLKAFIQV